MLCMDYVWMISAVYPPSSGSALQARISSEFDHPRGHTHACMARRAFHAIAGPASAAPPLKSQIPAAGICIPARECRRPHRARGAALGAGLGSRSALGMCMQVRHGLWYARRKPQAHLGFPAACPSSSRRRPLAIVHNCGHMHVSVRAPQARRLEPAPEAHWEPQGTTGHARS